MTGLVVVEQPEELVEPHVDGRRLDHAEVIRVEPDALGVDLGLDVAVAEQHGGHAIAQGVPRAGRSAGAAPLLREGPGDEALGASDVPA